MADTSPHLTRGPASGVRAAVIMTRRLLFQFLGGWHGRLHAFNHLHFVARRRCAWLGRFRMRAATQADQRIRDQRHREQQTPSKGAGGVHLGQV